MKAWVLAPLGTGDPAALSVTRIRKLFPSAQVIPVSEASAVFSKALEEDALLLVPDVAAFPQEYWLPLEEYLSKGGSAIFIGTHPFEDRAIRAPNGIYVPEREHLAANALRNAQHMPSISSVAAWVHENPVDQARGRVRLAVSPAHGWTAVSVEGEHLEDWAALVLPQVPSNTLSPEQRTIVFYARGSEQTTRFSVQCTERDGSLWRVSVPLTRIWKPYVLHEGQFEFISGSAHRGSESDSFSFSRMQSISIGVSTVADLQRASGYHYELSDVRWFADPRESKDVRRWPDVPLISPPKRHYTTRSARIRSLTDGRIWTLPRPMIFDSPFPRSRGLGGDSGTDFRWIPLFEALDEHDALLGWPCSIFVETRSNRVIRQWAWVGAPAECPEVLFQSMLIEAARRLQSGIYLHHAGSPRFAISPGEQLAVTAQVAWRASLAPRLDVVAELYRQGERVHGRRVRVPLTSDGHAQLSLGPAADVGSEAENWSIRIDLIDPAHGILYDTLTHFFVARPQRPNPDRADWITCSGSQFVFRGRRQFWIGVLYHPATAVGLLPTEISYARWLAPGVFDPTLIERDFDRLVEIGANAISLSYTDPSESSTLLYVIEAAKRRGLWIYVRMPSWNPAQPDIEQLRMLFDAAQLNREPPVMMLDIPPASVQDIDVSVWDQAWRNWLAEQYGTIEHAERILGVRLWRNKDGDICVPRNAEGLSAIPGHHAAVAVYRRFLRDYYSRRIGYVVRCLRSWGATQLITAKVPMLDPASGDAGYYPEPSPWWGCSHLDFHSLDMAASVRNERQHLKSVWGTAYARGASGGKPVIWSDVSVAVPTTDATVPDLQEQARKIENLFDVAWRTHVGGLFSSAYAGGRLGSSRQDVGLTHPDGTWRPVALAYREAANRMRRERNISGASSKRHFVVVDDDFGENADSYWQRYEDEWRADPPFELRPSDFGLRSSQWTARTWGVETFLPPAPLRSLNAEWGRLEIADRELIRRPDEPVRMTKGERLRADIMNTGPVSWDASREGLPQCVWIKVSRSGHPAVWLSLPPLAFGKSATVTWVASDRGEWTARAWLAGVGEFGEVLHIQVTE